MKNRQIMSDDETINGAPSCLQENFAALQVDMVDHDMVLLEARMTRVVKEMKNQKSIF